MAFSSSKDSSVTPPRISPASNSVTVGLPTISERLGSGMLAFAGNPTAPEVEVLSAWTQWLLKIEERPRELLPLLSSAVPLLVHCLQADCITFHPYPGETPSSVLFQRNDNDYLYQDEDDFEESDDDDLSFISRQRFIHSHALVLNGKNRGQLEIERASHPFTEQERVCLASIVQLIETRVEDSSARQETIVPVASSNTARFRQMLQQLGIALQAGAELEETLETVVHLAVQIADAESAIIRLQDESHRYAVRAISGGDAIQSLRSIAFTGEEGVIGRVARERKSLIVNHFDAVSEDYPSVVREAGIRNLLCVPITSQTRQQAIGTLTVHNKRGGAGFTEEDQETLLAFASHAAIAVEKATLREEQREAAEEASLLHEFTHTATSLNLAWVLTVAAAKLKEIADVAGCSLFLYHSQRSMLHVAEQCGNGIAEGDALFKQGLSLSLNDPLYRRLSQGVPVDLPDPNIASKSQDELLRAFAPHAPILIPLFDHQQLVGMVALTPQEDAPPLTSRQCRILVSVGRQIATVIENARLYEEAERQVEELSALHRISQATSSSLNLKEMLDTVLAEVAEVMSADSGSIMLYVPEKDHLKIEASCGISPRISRKAAVAMGEGVAGWVALHREPLLVNNLDHDPRFKLVSLRPEIHSAIIVPLMVKNRLLGVLSVSNNAEGRYAQRDLYLMKTMGASISIAIENARHYDAERQIAQIARDALLPRVPLEVAGYEIGEKHVPSHEVGGDYYNIFDVGCGKVGILISDVSGKSVYAAMHAAMGKHSIRALSHRCETPAEVLAHANTLIARETPPEIFITVFYGVLDIESGELIYCNAGHVPPLLVRADHTQEELTETGMVLGLWEDTPFENARTFIHPGEVLLCYTDGVTEAKRGTELFGYNRLKATLKKNWNRPAQEMVDLVYRRTLAFCGKKTDDDLALLAIKRKK